MPSITRNRWASWYGMCGPARDGRPRASTVSGADVPGALPRGEPLQNPSSSEPGFLRARRLQNRSSSEPLIAKELRVLALLFERLPDHP